VASVDNLTPIAPPASPARTKRRTVIVVGLLVLAVGALLSQGLLHSLNYFDTVDEVLQHKSSIGTSVIRLEGVVKPGTVHRSTNGASFVVTGSQSHQIYVIETGNPPQLFQANIPVVVVGHFAASNQWTFYGNQILVKHSASYIAQHPQRVKAPNGSVR
jgi:cytochrome c-type biogenesis protein CcmE